MFGIVSGHGPGKPHRARRGRDPRRRTRHRDRAGRARRHRLRHRPQHARPAVGHGPSGDDRGDGGAGGRRRRARDRGRDRPHRSRSRCARWWPASATSRTGAWTCSSTASGAATASRPGTPRSGSTTSHGGLEMQRNAVWAHVITAHAAVPLMVARGRGLVVEVTDGVERQVSRLAVLRPRQGVGDPARARRWRPTSSRTASPPSPSRPASCARRRCSTTSASPPAPGATRSPRTGTSRSPRRRGSSAARSPRSPPTRTTARWSGRAVGSWDLARVYGFEDADGARPDWGAYAATL